MVLDWQENPWSTSLIILIIVMLIIIIVLATAYQCRCAPRNDPVTERSEQSLVFLPASYEGVFKIFRTDAVKIIKLTIRPSANTNFEVVPSRM
jgi:uncharacterized membrane protein